MKLETRHPRAPFPAGYSMIELVVVVGLIVVMAAVAIPNITGYLRTYKIRGATQQVSGEIQTARNKAIVKNTNQGVAFAILDANSYRFGVLDDDENPPPAVVGRGLAPLRDLPAGVVFVPAATTPFFGVGFDRLGRRCQLASSGCAAAQTAVTMCTPSDTRCTDKAAGNYLDTDPLDTTTIRVRVRDEATGLERVIRIATGGRVLNQK